MDIRNKKQRNVLTRASEFFPIIDEFASAVYVCVCVCVCVCVFVCVCVCGGGEGGGGGESFKIRVNTGGVGKELTEKIQSYCDCMLTLISVRKLHQIYVRFTGSFT